LAVRAVSTVSLWSTLVQALGSFTGKDNKKDPGGGGGGPVPTPPGQQRIGINPNPVG